MAHMGGSASEEIDAPLQKVWEVVEDVVSAPDWQGGLVSITALEHDSEGRPTLVESENDIKVRHVKTQVRFAYEPPTRLSWTQEKGDLKSVEGAWVLEPARGLHARRAAGGTDLGVDHRAARAVDGAGRVSRRHDVRRDRVPPPDRSGDPAVSRAAARTVFHLGGHAARPEPAVRAVPADCRPAGAHRGQQGIAVGDHDPRLRVQQLQGAARQAWCSPAAGSSASRC